MRTNHIVNLLEEQALTSMRSSDLALIHTHTETCADCRLAYESARISNQLLRQRASVVFEPPPFFETRVLAAVREQQQEGESFGLWKIWSSARSLIVSMGVIVVLLTGFTYQAGWNGDAPQDKNDTVATVFEDPTDLMIYGKDSFDDDDISDGQVLFDLYNDDTEGANGK